MQLPDGQAVPDKVFLVDLKTAIAYEAHVVWRRYPLVGLAFDHQHGLTEASTPHLRILKQLWMSARERGEQSEPYRFGRSAVSSRRPAPRSAPTLAFWRERSDGQDVLRARQRLRLGG